MNTYVQDTRLNTNDVPGTRYVCLHHFLYLTQTFTVFGGVRLLVSELKGENSYQKETFLLVLTTLTVIRLFEV